MPPSADRVLLELVADVQGVLDLAELRGALLDAVARAVPADWISLNDIGPDPSDLVVVARPELEPEQVAVFAAHAHENPLLVRWLQTRDGRAYRFSDVAGRAELDRLALFREFYNPLGVRHQIAFTLPAEAERVLAVALSRRRRNFTDRERTLLDRARPFLIQAYRNALAVRALEHQLGEQRRGRLAALAARGLTGREAEVTLAVARGGSNASIAQDLGISDRTVQKHLERVFAKLGVRSRAAAAERVWELTPRDAG